MLSEIKFLKIILPIPNFHITCLYLDVCVLYTQGTAVGSLSPLSFPRLFLELLACHSELSPEKMLERGRGRVVLIWSPF